MSAAPPQLLPATPGGTEYELLLLALTARLSQWSQLERQSEQVRRLPQRILGERHV
jgi:hypothetical protein